MDEEIFGFKLDPFGPNPDPRFVVLTPPHREALATLVYAIDQREGWALLHGGAGLGKTTLLQSLMQQLDQKVNSAVVSRPHPEVLPFLNQIALTLGLKGPYESKGQFLEDVRTYLKQRSELGEATLLVVDDAQLLTPELLTEIRLLGNEDKNSPRVLNLFLSARPMIYAQMERGNEMGLHQLLRRRPKLVPLDEEQTAEYVKKRLKIAGGDPELFDSDALLVVHQVSHGVPRGINALCHLCLVKAGQNENSNRIGPDLVRTLLEQVPRLVSTPEQGWVLPDEKTPPPSPVPHDHDNFPTPENPWDACAHPPPRPEIGPEEQKLENRLMNRCASLYRGMSWWDKNHRLYRGVGQHPPATTGYFGASLSQLLPPLGGSALGCPKRGPASGGLRGRHLRGLDCGPIPAGAGLGYRRIAPWRS